MEGQECHPQASHAGWDMGCFDYKQEKPILSASSIGAHGRLQGSQGTPKIGMSIGASLKGRVPALIQPWGLGSRWFRGTFLINHSSAVHSSSLSLQSGVLSPASELLLAHGFCIFLWLAMTSRLLSIINRWI